MQFFMLLCWLCVSQLLANKYDLPVLPDLMTMLEAMRKLDGPYLNATFSTLSDYTKHIPRQIFVTLKDVPPKFKDLPPHILGYLTHQKHWSAIIANDKYVDRFMNEVFANTSVLWAYESITPSLFAAKADIWRYSVLYAYGGVYIDADASFHADLDKFILPSDKFILSCEKNKMYPCYQPTYPLGQSPVLYDNYQVLQWMIFSAPQHPFLSQTLTNVVAIIKSIYIRKSILLATLSEKKNAMFCATGPAVFTHSIREVISTTSNKTLGHRRAGTDYPDVRAKYKAAGRDGLLHYSSLMEHGTPLLHSLES